MAAPTPKISRRLLLRVAASWRERTLARGRREAMGLNKFDEDWYLATYPDVAQSVFEGSFYSGRDHFIRYGHAEKRIGFHPTLYGGKSRANPFVGQHIRSDWPYYYLIQRFVIAAIQRSWAALKTKCRGIFRSSASGISAAGTNGALNYVFRCGPSDVVLIGWTARSALKPRVAGANGVDLRVRLLSKHRRTDVSPEAEGFIVVVEAEKEEPVAVSFDDRDALSIGESAHRDDFQRLCNNAGTEVILDLALLSGALELSDAERARLDRALVRELAGFYRTKLAKPSFAVAIERAWAGSSAGALVFQGWLFTRGAASEIDVRCVVLRAGKPIPVSFFPGSVSRPDLDSLNRPYKGESRPGFIGYLGPNPARSGSVGETTIYIIVKDATGCIHAVSRTARPIDDRWLLESATASAAQALKFSRTNGIVGGMLQTLFPVEFKMPAAAESSCINDEVRSCHLFLEINSEYSELHTVLNEIVRNRFTRIVLTCISGTDDPQLSESLHAFERENDGLEVIWRVVRSLEAASASEADIEQGGIVISGRPYDIFQFDLADDAIDQILKEVKAPAARSLGYVYDDCLRRFSARESASPTQVPVQDVEMNMFRRVAGFAAFMPSAHFNLTANCSGAPFFSPSSGIKARLMALKRAGMAEIRSFGGPVFYGSQDEPRLDEIPEMQVVEQIDYYRAAAAELTTHS